MLLEHWLFPASTSDLIRCQFCSTKAAEAVSLLGSLQFTRRLLAWTGTDFAREGWQLPDGDPVALACNLTPVTVGQFVSGCREDFQRILQSVDL